MPVLIGVGAVGTRDVLHLVQDAQNADAAGVLLAPLTYQLLTDDEVFGLYEEVTGHLSVPQVVYDNPATTGLALAVVSQVHRESARYGVDADMENQARTRRGKPRVPVESLVVRLAMKEAVERLPTSRLTIEDARTAARVAEQRLRTSLDARPDAVGNRIYRLPVG